MKNEKELELVVDSHGYVWWRCELEGGTAYSMVRTNPDNSPIPFPVTVYKAITEREEGA